MTATAAPATAAPATADWPETEPAGRPKRPLALRRLRGPSTPSLLRVGMALACLPVAFFAIAVQVGVARNDSTVRTVGRDATRGITVAQAIKLNLAELDETVVQDLLEGDPLTASGFPEDYNAKRAELHDNLVLAAAESSAGAAFRQPLANIEYALAHYHTLAGEAFAARDQGDTERAARVYAQAHEVAESTLLSEADFVDKANTYVLNDTYDRQKARAESTVRLIVVSWVVLIAFLVVAQVFLARRFRRLVNLGMAAATLVAVVAGAFALERLDTSAGELTIAREQAFDSVHVLARARATVVSARQSQGQRLFDPRDADAEVDFQTQVNRLFRVQDGSDVAALARDGTVPESAGGYLATATQESRESASRPALVAFGDFLYADAELRQLIAAGDTQAAVALYEDGQGSATFAALSEAIDDAQALDQAVFDAHADSAAEAAAPVDKATLAAAGAVLVLVLLGFYQRLREYRT